jgi:hypothetical protein
MATFANHRKALRDKSVSENDAIFCIPLYWNAKNGIVFAYQQDSRPAAASGNISCHYMAAESFLDYTSRIDMAYSSTATAPATAKLATPVTAAVRDGLGNQLFIVVSALAHARRQGRPALFRRDAAYGYRAAYWDSLLAAAPSAAPGSAECDAIEVGRAGRAHFQEAAHTFAEVPAGADTLLGFFQSARYFGAEFAAVAADLRLADLRAAVRAKCAPAFAPSALAPSALGGAPELPETISLHFRLGDYKWQASHVLRCDYYWAALGALIADLDKSASDKSASRARRVLYFYELEDQTVIDHWVAALRSGFPAVEFVAARECVSSALADWEEMLLMSCCDHHVIANSSFSWWGAYLKRCDDPDTRAGAPSDALSRAQTVVAPRVWFGSDEASLARSRDICPGEWILV